MRLQISSVVCTSQKDENRTLMLCRCCASVFPAFGIGESGLRALVIATTLGFPPALVLAWVYDLTRDGIRDALFA